MSKTDKLTPHQRVILLNEIAERDKQLAEQKREIDHYKRQYEIAVRRKLKERHDRTERRKDIVTLAVLLLVVSAIFVPIMLGAIRQFNLWLMVG